MGSYQNPPSKKKAFQSRKLSSLSLLALPALKRVYCPSTNISGREVSTPAPPRAKADGPRPSGLKPARPWPAAAPVTPAPPARPPPARFVCHLSIQGNLAFVHAFKGVVRSKMKLVTLCAGSVDSAILAGRIPPISLISRRRRAFFKSSRSAGFARPVWPSPRTPNTKTTLRDELQFVPIRFLQVSFSSCFACLEARLLPVHYGWVRNDHTQNDAFQSPPYSTQFGPK